MMKEQNYWRPDLGVLVTAVYLDLLSNMDLAKWLKRGINWTEIREKVKKTIKIFRGSR